MPGEIPTLQDLVNETAPLVQSVILTPMKCLMDAKGFLTLSQGWTSGPVATSPLLKTLPQQQLDALIDQAFPLPPADALPESQVVQLFIQAAETNSGAAMTSALGELEKLPWGTRFQVFEDLASQAPSMDGQNYLEISEGIVATLPNADQALWAGMVVILMLHGGRTLSSIDLIQKFTTVLLVVDERAQWRLLSKLGIQGPAIEGTIADFSSQAMAAGLLNVPQVLVNILEAGKATTNIGKWINIAKRVKGMILGQQAHLAIAAAYVAANQPTGPLHQIYTNFTPVGSILSVLERDLAFVGERIELALTLSRPDIFDFSIELHPIPPGWVYEIKSCNGNNQALAQYEMTFYVDVLNACAVPSGPGPMGTPGTFGCRPAPGGWFAYSAVEPGVILYYYKEATLEEITAKGLDPSEYQAPQQTLQQTMNALKAINAPPAELVKVGIYAVMCGALIDALWALQFLV